MFFDTAVPFQINLQDSATYGMEMIIQLHNYVMFLNVFIISVVIWFFFEIIAVTSFVQWFSYRVTLRTNTKLHLSHLIYLQINKAMLHMSTLEVIWTLLPVLALISIALPSLSMLYYFSLSFSPAVVINVIGHQWFWSYEYQPYNDGLISAFPFVDSSKELFDNNLNLSQYQDVSSVESNGFMHVYNDATEFKFKNMLSTVAQRRDFSASNVDLALVQSTVNQELTKYAFDSIMLQVEDLSYGSFRLLEVDKPLYLPVDTPIRVIVSSDDVLHSWAIPSLGVKIDCVPGRLNVVEFRIARTGVFYGQCSEICGTQHGFMPICIVSVPRKLFNFI